MEIQVGEFIRTKYGIITKIVNTDEHCRHFGERLEDTIYIVDNEKLKYRLNAEDIKKHSFNIVDLIEEGDYVNGKEVSQVLKDKKGNITDVCYYEEAEEQMYSLGDIKSIVTKENFKEMEYEVK